MNLSKIYKSIENGINIALNEELGSPAFENMPSRSNDIRKVKKTGYSIKNSDDAKSIIKVGLKDIIIEAKNKFKQENNKFWWNTLYESYQFNKESDRQEEYISIYIGALKQVPNYYDYFEYIVQNLANYIDINFPYYLQSGWAGNVGYYANKIYYSNTGYCQMNNKKLEYNDDRVNNATMIKRKNVVKNLVNTINEYIDDNDIDDIATIENIYCIRIQLETNEIKDSSKSTDIVFDDIKEQVRKNADKYIKKYSQSATVTLEIGKKQYEYSPYESFILRDRKGDYGYIGQIIVSQNKFGDCNMQYSSPGSGSSSFDFNIKDIDKYMKKIIDYIMN